MAKTDKPNPWRYAHMGLEFAGAALVLALVGWFIDGRYGTEPWGAMIGAAIGFTGGFYLFIKDALAANRENAAATKAPDSKPSAPKSERDRQP